MKRKLIALSLFVLILIALTGVAVTANQNEMQPRAYLPIITSPHRSIWGTPQPCIEYPDGRIACP